MGARRCVAAADPDGLRLGADVRRHEDPGQGEDADRPGCGSSCKDTGDDEDISITVDDVIQEITARACHPHIPGECSVERVEYGVEGDHDDGEHDAAGVERDTRKYRYKKR